MPFGLRRRRHVPSALSALLVEWIRSSHGVPVESVVGGSISGLTGTHNSTISRVTSILLPSRGASDSTC
ncbi:hypothetical protein [Escherichia phage ZCEC13]|uniref:Uncharacterized protein n=1 Tax=Escherichia phage ZCEC13 TaxID=2935866 RepID=A0AAE9KSY9_9CAUD|nr:hypothetical protein [Escherichia phage ZCEC13]